MIDVPPVVQSKVKAVGATGWLDDLPELVADVAAAWSLTVGDAFGDATEAFVAAAVLEDGTDAVLKLMVPRGGAEAAHEIEVLSRTGGDGCARLLRHDLSRGALLLERLGPSLYELARPYEERIEILCDLARRVWRAAPDATLPTGADQGRRLAELIAARWEALDRPCSERAVDHALRCASSRVAAHDDERSLLVHGDVHQWNALLADEGFKLVDPDGLLAEPEYDMGILMREDPEELVAGDAHERARWLAARTGLDEVAIWEWGVVERVSTGLLGTEVGLQPVARQMLAAADQVAD
jgi:streptomycin 6-kinase